MTLTMISASDLMGMGSSRGATRTTLTGADNDVLRAWLAAELTAEVSRTKETGEPLDQGRVESLIQRLLLVDLSDLASKTGREQNHGLVNEKLKAFAAWRSSGRASPKKGGSADDDDLTDAEKAALGSKAK